jgi:hypothetical protein
MHTFKGDKGTIFNYNEDFSGDIIVKDVTGNEVTIDGNDILDFVAHCYVQPKRIEKLEQSDSIELLVGTKI